MFHVQQAVKILNMIKVYGKPIRVNKASQDKRSQDMGANLFIGNLDPEVDEKVGPIPLPAAVPATVFKRHHLHCFFSPWCCERSAFSPKRDRDCSWLCHQHALRTGWCYSEAGPLKC